MPLTHGPEVQRVRSSSVLPLATPGAKGQEWKAGRTVLISHETHIPEGESKVWGNGGEMSPYFLCFSILKILWILSNVQI